MLLTLGCGDKEPDCPDYDGDACSDHGLEDELRTAFCDECGALWSCRQESGGWVLGLVDRPCSCINDSGYFDPAMSDDCSQFYFRQATAPPMPPMDRPAPTGETDDPTSRN